MNLDTSNLLLYLTLVTFERHRSSPLEVPCNTTRLQPAFDPGLGNDSRVTGPLLRAGIHPGLQTGLQARHLDEQVFAGLDGRSLAAELTPRRLQVHGVD